MRIVCGVLVGLTALPVVFTWVRTREPEFDTPRLALSLRVWSIVAHVLAGALILGTAISEIWLNLDTVGQWLFGIYGAAGAIALLGAFMFYLAFMAELPPPPPKPLKPTSEKTRRRGQGNAGSETPDTDDPDAAAVAPAPTADDTVEGDADSTAAEADSTDDTAGSDDEAGEDTPDTGKLRNRRPAGKARRGLPRGGVAVED